MKASILLASYAVRKTILPTIYSLLDQDFKKSEYEIIIIDNVWLSKEDKTAIPEIMKNFENIKCSFDKRKKTSELYNEAIKKSKSENILFIAPHCIPQRSWLSDSLNHAKNTDEKMITGTMVCIDSKHPVGIYEKKQHERILAHIQKEKRKGTLDYHNAIIRKEKLIKHGLFDTRFRTVACVNEFGIRCSMNGETGQITDKTKVLHSNETALSKYCKLAYLDGFDSAILNLKYSKNEKFRIIHPKLAKYSKLILSSRPLLSIIFTSAIFIALTGYSISHVIGKNEFKQEFINIAAKNSHRLGQIQGLKRYSEHDNRIEKA